MITNHSRPVKFDPGTLVVYGRQVYLVDHNSGPDTCHLKRGGDIIKVPERFLRKMKWSEFCLFKHPVTGNLMSGKTRGYMALVIHLFTALLFSASIVQDASWWSAFALIPVVGYWIGTRMNFIGKWK